MNRIRSATRVVSFTFLSLLLLAAGSVPRAWGCNTPVYRYAMYNWPPAPYYVFYIHHGQTAGEDESVNKTVDGLSEAEPPANVVLEVVDASQEEQLERLPEVVIKAQQTHADGTAPVHLVFTAWGIELFGGRLDAATLKAMVDSPARKRLGELLHEGNAAVLLILTGPDEEANKQAEKAAGEAAAKVNSGEIDLGFDAGGPMMPPQSPPGTPEDAAAEEDREDSSGKLKLAVLKVSRTDPAEKWLVDSLLFIEPDLRDEEFAKQPMVFAVYGRGQAMPPYVGKGITEENLIDCVAFLSGPCSCMIKEQNPGMDLLMQWDWDATAEKMAAEDEQFAMGPFGYQEFVPDDPGDSVEESPPETAESPESPESPGGIPQAEVPAPKSPEPTVAAAAPVPKAPAGPARVVKGRREVAARTESPREVESFAVRQAWVIGVGLAVGAVLVLAVGLVFARRQRPD